MVESRNPVLINAKMRNHLIGAGGNMVRLFFVAGAFYVINGGLLPLSPVLGGYANAWLLIKAVENLAGLGTHMCLFTKLLAKNLVCKLVYYGGKLYAAYSDSEFANKTDEERFNDLSMNSVLSQLKKNFKYEEKLVEDDWIEQSIILEEVEMSQNE